MNQLSKILLALFVTFFTLTLGLGLYLVTHAVRMRNLEARLLSKHELQRRMLADRDTDRAVFPHTSHEIGFVLNPHMESSTWRSGGDEPYEINTLGLRGGEIGPKPEGVTRVALVGDSMLFGWRLPDRDVPATKLKAIVDERVPGHAIEFVTIALPGWNITSERAFLDHHLDRLDLDFVVWSVIGNDLDDAAGAIPPGIMANWASSQKEHLAPVIFASNFVRDLPMPTVMARWNRNIEIIQRFEEETKIPVAILWWRDNEERYILEHVLRRRKYDPPRIVVPKRYRYGDKRWIFSGLDVHPTPWATEILAVGMLGRLVDLEVLPALGVDAQEQEIVAAFRGSSGSMPKQSEINGRFQARLERVATAYVDGEWRWNDSTLYGLSEGRMEQQGMFFLRNEIDAETLRLRIAAPDAAARVPFGVTITVRNRRSEAAQVELELSPGENEISIPLPANATRFPVFEVGWAFDYAFCDDPSSCTSGTLLRAEFLD